MNTTNSKPTHIIFGLGQSGWSCARYFDRIGQSYFVVDSRKSPSGQEKLSDLKLCEGFQFGDISEALLTSCELLVVSPGISLKNKFIAKAMQLNIEVCGDVELFVKNTKKPIVAITGSNGKSTVTDLTDRLIQAAGMNSQKGGNIGLPVLDFLPQDDADIYVLELSSFQLDTCYSLKAMVAVCLNITEDHMDRYDTFEDYVASKHKIYNHAEFVIFNQDDSLTYPNNQGLNQRAFSINKTRSDKVPLNYLGKKDNDNYIIVNGKEILPTRELSVTGKHNWSNILASLSILDCLNIEILDSIIYQLKSYKGLKHRYQLVSRKHGCEWINDSKATNVGATVAALNSLDMEGSSKLILIAGGDSKQSDLAPLINPINNTVSYLILMGVDANKIAQLPIDVKIFRVENMKEAVEKASSLINEGDFILLSPACASIDMYSNFEARGDDFIKRVKECA